MIVTNNKVTLAWVEHNSEAVVSSSLQRKLTGDDDSTYSSIALTSGETTYTDTGLMDDTGYTYRIETVYPDTTVYSAEKKIETYGPYYLKIGDGTSISEITFSLDIIIDSENNRRFEFSEFNETLPTASPIYEILTELEGIDNSFRISVMQFLWDPQEINDYSFSYPVPGGAYTDPDGRSFFNTDPYPLDNPGVNETLSLRLTMFPYTPKEKSIASIKGFKNPPQPPTELFLEVSDSGKKVVFTPAEITVNSYENNNKTATFSGDNPDFYLVEFSDDGGATWNTLDLISAITTEATIAYEIPQRFPEIEMLRLRSSNLAGYSDAVVLSVEI